MGDNMGVSEGGTIDKADALAIIANLEHIVTYRKKSDNAGYRGTLATNIATLKTSINTADKKIDDADAQKLANYLAQSSTLDYVNSDKFDTNTSALAYGAYVQNCGAVSDLYHGKSGANASSSNPKNLSGFAFSSVDSESKTLLTDMSTVKTKAQTVRDQCECDAVKWDCYCDTNCKCDTDCGCNKVWDYVVCVWYCRCESQKPQQSLYRAQCNCEVN
jgi:hypothetical protein